MDLADSDLSTIIFKETLKDYEILIGENYKRSESGAEVISPRFTLWNKSRRDLDLADSDLSTIIFKETLKDYEMLIGEDYKRSESGAEVTSPRFTLWNKSHRTMNHVDSNISTIIFKEALNDYEMLIGEDSKRSESGAEVSKTSFHLWNKSRRAINRADSDSLKSSLRIIP